MKVDYPKNGTIVFGPLTNIPYTESDLQQLYRDYTVPNNDRTGFHRFLRQIPCLSMNSLLKKCLFFNYCLYGELLTLDQLISSDASMQTTLTDASLLEETYQTKENEQHNQTYAIEEQILNLVKTGNYQGFKNIEFSDSNYHLGVTGSTALRQLKNNIIITTTLCTRASIEGGLDYDSAYQLSDYFIRASERLNSIERLYDLLSKVGYTFAEKVADAKTPVSTDGCIQKAIRNDSERIQAQAVINRPAPVVYFPWYIYIFSLSSVIIDQTSFQDDLSFCIGHITKLKCDLFQRISNHISLDLSVLIFYRFSDLRYEDVVAVLEA